MFSLECALFRICSLYIECSLQIFFFKMCHGAHAPKALHIEHALFRMCSLYVECVLSI